MLNNSERFIIAHKTAKQIRRYFASYRGAFAFALSEVYAMEKQGALAAEKTTAEKLEDLGVKAWERDGMKRCYYLNDDQLEPVFGLSIVRGIWYDANANNWVQNTEYGTRPLNDTLAGSLRV